jgi:spore germination protein KC
VIRTAPGQKTKAIFLLLFCLSLLILEGCWDRRELNDMSIVLGTAIDKQKGKNLEVTVQVLVPQATGGSQKSGMGSGGGPQVLIRSAAGRNIADAMSKVQEKFPRRLFWGHCKAYIFNEQVAKEGLHEEIDFLIRHPEARVRSHLFISKGNAGSILALHPPLEHYLGEALRKLAEEKIGVNITLKDFQQMIIGEAGGAVLPYIQILPTIHGEPKKESIANFIGTAIFRRDKMVGTIDDKVTRGILWLRNEAQVTSITMKFNKGNGTVSLDPIREHTDLIPYIENGKWKMTAKIDAEGGVIQNATNVNLLNPEMTPKLQNELKKVIEKRIHKALKQVQKGMKVDVFRFAEAFERKYPDEWDKVKDQWNKVFPQVEVTLDIKTHVRRIGMATRPAGLPQQEIETK